MKTVIECSDTVRVDFNQSRKTLCSRATVLSRLYQPGDYWIFQDQETNSVHYVSEPCNITLLEKK